MDETPNLKLPYILPSQAQKHVTHNEALRLLDCCIQLSVESRAIAAAPDNPANGVRYIVAANASGAWAGMTARIAAWQDGAWAFSQPSNGWLAFVRDEFGLAVFDGSTWTDLASVLSGFDKLGINTAADPVNRLALSSDAALFTHAGAGHRLAINKAAQNNTASVLFQDAFGGRAEIGLCGDDRLRIKASANGADWRTAMLVEGSGKVSFPENGFGEHLAFNLLHDGGRFAGSPENPSLAAGAFAAPAYLTSYNGSSFTAAGKYTHNSSSFGGTAAAVDADIQSLMEMLKSAIAARRYGPEFHALRVTPGTGTLSPRTSAGVVRYLALGNRPGPLPARSSWGVNIKVLGGTLAIADRPETGAGHIGGVPMSADAVLSAADGWVQFAISGAGSPETSSDYNSTLFPLYAEPGAVFLLALPYVCPGLVKPVPGAPIGRLAGIQSWR